MPGVVIRLLSAQKKADISNALLSGKIRAPASSFSDEAACHVVFHLFRFFLMSKHRHVFCKSSLSSFGFLCTC
jgi:hypothetical protein